MRKTCYEKNKGFSVQIKGNNFVNLIRDNKTDNKHNSELIKPKGLLIYNPKKTIICEAQAKKLKIFPKKKI